MNCASYSKKPEDKQKNFTFTSSHLMHEWALFTERHYLIRLGTIYYKPLFSLKLDIIKCNNKHYLVQELVLFRKWTN